MPPRFAGFRQLFATAWRSGGVPGSSPVLSLPGLHSGGHTLATAGFLAMGSSVFGGPTGARTNPVPLGPVGRGVGGRDSGLDRACAGFQAPRPPRGPCAGPGKPCPSRLFPAPPGRPASGIKIFLLGRALALHTGPRSGSWRLFRLASPPEAGHPRGRRDLPHLGEGAAAALGPGPGCADAGSQLRLPPGASVLLRRARCFSKTQRSGVDAHQAGSAAPRCAASGEPPAQRASWATAGHRLAG